MGGLSSAAVIAALALVSSITSQVYDLNSARSEMVNQEARFSHTVIEIQSLYAQSGSDLVSLELSNIGSEKLWDYDGFDVLVTYTANIDGISTPLAERFSFDSDGAFSYAGRYSGSLQFARPDEDISKGGWSDATGGNNNGILYDEINEVIRNDANYARSSSLTVLGQSDTWQVGLSDVLDPKTSSDHVVRYVYRKNASGGIIVNLTVSLMQDSTQIASWTHNNISDAFTLETQTLSAVQADSITNYTDLRLVFVATYDSGLLPGRAADVSWAEMQVPPTSGVYDCSAVTLSQKKWVIDRITSDILDPKIINANEGALMCIKLTYPVFANGDVNVMITTDVGRTVRDTIVT